ncbi:MAG TPA: response regulator [Vicinamibacterales bacterium]|nr:response regulator [Vicinamibacterales bacterium]
MVDERPACVQPLLTATPHAGQLSEKPEVSSGPSVLMIVRDTGTGMTDDVRARIFEPFFTTKGVGQGTGLGLATVYGIVQQSGGHLWVESAPGFGSSFTLCLPATSEAAEPRPAVSERTDANPRGTETVLVVEDNDVVRAMARETLMACGYQVLEASNGQNALQVAGDSLESISLVLTDVVMPVMGGRELATRLQASRPTLRFIFMSGYASDPDVGDREFAPAAAFLQKPFSPALLGRTVRDVIDGRLSPGPVAALPSA